MIPPVEIDPEVAAALRHGRPVVALESTLIAHGLPRPLNLEVARQLEEAVRAEGAVPATVGVWQGRPIVGLSAAALEELATSDQVMKASRRDLAAAVALGRTAATTVAATMFLAHLAGIRVFATGGIGGVHRHISPLPARERGRGEGEVADVSADLIELARTPVAVVCAGAKGILDIPATLEVLETHGVPVVGFQTDDFPAFYVRSSGEKAPLRLDEPAQVAMFLSSHWKLHGAGVVVAQPVAADVALAPAEFKSALAKAEELAAGVRGKALTPFLLARLAELTDGKTLRANQALVIANARLAGRIAQNL